MPKTEKAPEPQRLPSCMRCGHPKTEHVDLRVAAKGGQPVFVCPTSLFLLDTFQADLEQA